LLVGEESATHQRSVEAITSKAVRVPVAVIKGDELSAPKSSNRTAASAALLGKKVSEAVGAVRSVVARRELFPSKDLVAVGDVKQSRWKGWDL